VDSCSFNAEYPLEVDDEFWENDDPQLAFLQPPDKPSTVVAFNLWLRLTDIVAFTMHSLVGHLSCHCFAPSLSRPKDYNERNGPSSGLRAEGILARLNESLTEWAEKVPQHCAQRIKFSWPAAMLTIILVRWTPEIEDAMQANQSATLYTTYNLVMILMQRAFLPSSIALLCSPRDIPPTPSLAHALTARAVSVNAAKAIVRILTIVHKRALSNIPLLLVSAEITAAVLCIDRWIIKAREGTSPTRAGRLAPASAQTIEYHLQDLKSLLAILRWAAPRWETARERL
jgi:hypothetical protein